jgi:phosphatidylserine decarboxylase
MDDHRSTYESRPRRSPTQWIQSQPLYDRLYAIFQDSRLSAKQIEPFIRKNQIDMDEFERVDYRSFGEFFTRRFRPGMRNFPSIPGEMGAFAEARYFAWEKLDAEQRFPIKTHSLSTKHLLGTAERARPFLGGPVITVRLVTSTIPTAAGLWNRIGSEAAIGPLTGTPCRPRTTFFSTMNGRSISWKLKTLGA